MRMMKFAAVALLCAHAHGKTITDFLYVSGDLTNIDLTQTTRPPVDGIMKGIFPAWTMEAIGERYAAVGSPRSFNFTNSVSAAQMNAMKNDLEYLVPTTDYSSTNRTYYFIDNLDSLEVTTHSRIYKPTLRLQDIYTAYPYSSPLVSRDEMYGFRKGTEPAMFQSFTSGESLNYRKSYLMFHEALTFDSGHTTGGLRFYWGKHHDNEILAKVGITRSFTQLQYDGSGQYDRLSQDGTLCVYYLYGGYCEASPTPPKCGEKGEYKVQYLTKNSGFMSPFGVDTGNKCVFLFAVNKQTINWTTGKRTVEDPQTVVASGDIGNFGAVIDKVLEYIHYDGSDITMHSQVEQWMTWPVGSTKRVYEAFIQVNLLDIFYAEELRHRTTYDQ